MSMTLGERMKKYEGCYDFSITARVPVIIRIDGKKFSKFTQSRFNKPFDEHLVSAMIESTRQVLSNIEGCLFGFTQSDEATFVLRNDKSLESQAWVDNRIQKMISISSSIFTATFAAQMVKINVDTPAYFDARVFAVPSVDEAINNLIWRQRDATKNSIQCATYYEVGKIEGKKTTQKLMHGLKGRELQELLFQKTGKNWNDYPIHLKRGTGVYKKTWTTKDLITSNDITRSCVHTDMELPIFSEQREFLEKILGV